MRERLIKEIQKYYSVSEDEIIIEAISQQKMNFLMLRDCLLLTGRILLEDLENKVYVLEVIIGSSHAKKAIVSVGLDSEDIVIAAYGKEGLIKQGIAQQAINKIKDQIMTGITYGRNIPPKKKVHPIIIRIILVMIFGIVISFMFANNQTSKDNNHVIDESLKQQGEYQIALESYNESASLYNSSVDKYNALTVEVSVDNLEDFAINLGKVELLDTVEIAQSKEITKDQLSQMIEILNERTLDIQNYIKMMQQIKEPTESWVIDKLTEIESVVKIEAVTSDNDPNRLLGVEGGYISCVYFSVADINQDEIPGDTVVAKGTDCGGAIEVYETVEDALARCDYLGQFDGTLLYTGSYAIIGTSVIRISYKLDENQQFKLTEEIIQSFTKQEE